MLSASLKRRLDLAVLAFCGASAVILFVWFRGLRHDDAYITFQYARSIAEGDGFVFNAGERVLGTTTPLFTLLMALIYTVFGDVLPHAAIAISALAVGAQGVLVWLIVRDRAPIAAGVLAVLVVLGLGGMGVLALETSLYAALVLGTIAAVHHERYHTAGVCLGLAFLTRYDAGLLVLVVIGWHLIVRRALPFRTLLVSLAIVLPWLVFAQLYFGSVFPHTFGAKTSLTPVTAYLDAALDRMGAPMFGMSKHWFGSTLNLGAALLGARWAWKSCRTFLVLVAYSAGHLVAYAWIGPATNQTWHLHLPMLVFHLLVVAGVVGTLDELVGSTQLLRRRIAIGAIAIVSVAMLVTTARSLARYAASVETAYWLGARHHRYETVAGWLALHVRPDQTLMATEIGTFGYLTRRRMFDPFGLINETNDWPKSRSAAAKAALVEKYRPDVVLFDAERDALEVGGPLGYRIVHVFDWQEPWSTIAVRSDDALTPLGKAAARLR